MRGVLFVSERLYGALLHLYPRAFQAAYARQMRLTFRDACRAAYQRGGVGGLLALCFPTLFDLFKSALEAWARQGEITMLKERLIALAGPLTMVVGALWLLAAAGHLAFQTGLLADEELLGIVSIPFFLSFIPLLFAVIGTRLRFHPAAGGLGRFGLALSVAGNAGVMGAVLFSIALGAAAPEAAQGMWVNYAAYICLVSIRLGYILFGVEALRLRLLPRWNGLPLLVGLTVVLSLPMYWFGVPAVLPAQWANGFLHFGLTGAGWVLLGVAMMDQRRAPQPTAAL